MRLDKLRDEVACELELMEQTAVELQALGAAVGGQEPTVTLKAAAAAFLTQLFGGIERVLVRIGKHMGVEPPSGPHWHAALLDLFTEGTACGLPALLAGDLGKDLQTMRALRHVYTHMYSSLLQWSQMLPGIDAAPEVLARFRAAVEGWLAQQDEER